MIDNNISCGSLSFSFQPEVEEERRFATFTVVGDEDKIDCAEKNSGYRNREKPNERSDRSTFFSSLIRDARMFIKHSRCRIRFQETKAQMKLFRG